MGRASTPPEIDESALPSTTANASSAANGGDITATASDQNFFAIRDRLRFKRNTSYATTTATFAANQNRAAAKSSPAGDRWRWSHDGGSRRRRKGVFGCFPFPFPSHLRGVRLLYFVVFFAVFAFAMASVVLQSSITSVVVFKKGWSEHRRRSVKQGLSFGTTLRFFPGWRSRRLAEGRGLNHVRFQAARVGLRAPRLAVILGNTKKGHRSLLLITVVKNLQKIGYALKIYAVRNGKAISTWRQIGARISSLGPEQYDRMDWSTFDGVIVDSLEAKEAVSSLMQEPFCSVPLIWIIQEDNLANRLPVYEEKGWKHLLSHWRSIFKRANVVVFPDFTLPMLYSVLDTGNFFVIPGSPVDVWAAESYIRTHAKKQLRMDNRFTEDDIVVLVVGSSFFYDELSLDYAVAMHSLGPLLVKYAKTGDDGGSFKFLFLCGNTTDGDALQEAASRLGLLRGSVRHYGLNGDVDSVILMADIVLYGSSQNEQGFPSLVIRSMTFGIPVVAPDVPILNKYLTDGENGILFQKHNAEALMHAFSLLISHGKLSEFAQTVASSGRLLAKNLLASECITGYAKLLENVLSFPSDALLPEPMSQLEQKVWEWSLFRKDTEEETDDLLEVDEGDSSSRRSSVVYALEEELANHVNSTSISENGTKILSADIFTESDWEILREIESIEEYESLEMEELEERMERSPRVWDDIYRNARKSEKFKFQANEGDEGELERTGQPVCIYQIYSGAAAWPFLHHGSLYRGLSLSKSARRLRSDDVDAVAQLPLLNNSYYRNILCEIGGMFSIANRVDDIHKRPWIGFQSWRAAGRKVSLSAKAEKVLEEKIRTETKGDVMYFWASLEIDGGVAGSNDELTFWSMCDILNGGQCRTAFEGAFCQMYALPSSLEGLPPMPEDGGLWSALHSWVMPTPSFLEFIMFSRIFVDSLDALQTRSSQANKCLFSSSELEERHCYCRILEILVNVWAYHSARRMVYMDPRTGSLEEQHPIEQRKGVIWPKYFNITLLKSLDEDLAEAADDGDHPRERWLWPLTGEVHWQGIYEREREARYRLKMDKKRKTKEKLYDRMKSGYKQKPLET